MPHHSLRDAAVVSFPALFRRDAGAVLPPGSFPARQGAFVELGHAPHIEATERFHNVLLAILRR